MYWAIIGDSDGSQDRLEIICPSEEYAKERLEDMLTNPTREDKKMMEGHFNFRVEKFEENKLNWHKLNIKSKGYSSYGSKVYLDDTEIHGVTNITYEIGIDTPVPKATIEVNSLPDVDFMCAAHIDFTSNSVGDAIEVINNYLLSLPDRKVAHSVAKKLNRITDTFLQLEDELYRKHEDKGEV